MASRYDPGKFYGQELPLLCPGERGYKDVTGAELKKCMLHLRQNKNHRMYTGIFNNTSVTLAKRKDGWLLKWEPCKYPSYENLKRG